jgi:hypothetical protein
MIAKVIKPDGTIQEVVPANGKTFTLDELQHHVGGYIEILRMPGTGKAMMIVNEEGKLKSLPYNDVATKLWREGMEHHTGSGGVRLSDFNRISDTFPQGDWIVGQVLLCHDDQLEK